MRAHCGRRPAGSWRAPQVVLVLVLVVLVLVVLVVLVREARQHHPASRQPVRP